MKSTFQTACWDLNVDSPFIMWSCSLLKRRKVRDWGHLRERREFFFPPQPVLAAQVQSSVLRGWRESAPPTFLWLLYFLQATGLCPSCFNHIGLPSVLWSNLIWSKDWWHSEGFWQRRSWVLFLSVLEAHFPLSMGSESPHSGRRGWFLGSCPNCVGF